MYTLREAARVAKRRAYESAPEHASSSSEPDDVFTRIPSRASAEPAAPRAPEPKPEPQAAPRAPSQSAAAPRPEAARGWRQTGRPARYSTRPFASTSAPEPDWRVYDDDPVHDEPAASVRREPEAAERRDAAPAAPTAAAAPPPRQRFARMPEIDLDDAIGWLLSGKRWIVAGTIAGLLAGAAFGLTAQPRYTAYTDILVPPANLQVVANDLYAPTMQSDAQVLEIESRMRVLTSGNVLRRVAETLDLVHDEEFAGKPKWFDLRALLGSPPASGDPIVPVMRELSERIKAARQERSYLVTAAVWTWDPEKSVRVANALAEAFRQELVRGEASGAAQAAQTLNDRLAELKTAVSTAEDKVQAFRRENNLQQTAGQLVSAQSMQQINAKMIDAQARESEAAARYRQLTEARSGALDPSSSLQSPTITQLRVQYAELKRQVESMSLTYGPRHPALTTTRTQLKAIEREVSNETARMMTAAKIDLDQARAALASLAKDTAKARSSLSVDDEAQVKLRELERDAQAKGALYQAFLTRAGEATQREQVDATNVRVISTASPPERRSYPPRTALLAAGGAIAGFMFGCGLALAFGFLGAYRRMLRAG